MIKGFLVKTNIVFTQIITQVIIFPTSRYRGNHSANALPTFRFIS